MQAIFKNLGIYVHVPFCAKACSYCRFYKRAPTPLDMDSYIEAIGEEIGLVRALSEGAFHSEGDCAATHEKDICEGGAGRPPNGARPHEETLQPLRHLAPGICRRQDCTGPADPVMDTSARQLRADTVFWGGGTPSVLSEARMEKLADMLSVFGKASEWTVEVAPTGLTKSKLSLLKSLGVNRISMGVQSFNEKTLAALGRGHSLSAARGAIDLVAEQGFEHFNIDLIFCARGQEMREWLEDLSEAAAQPVDHISAYCLESETATSSCVGRLTRQDLSRLDREADFMLATMRRLPELGFHQYEVSNYSKPGCQCLHNLSVWNMARWIGLGPSAASQWRATRARNPDSLELWARALKGGVFQNCDVVRLSERTLFADCIIFGLRTRRGVDLRALCERFPSVDASRFCKAANGLAERGLLIVDSGTIRLTDEAIALADSVAAEFL